MKNIERMLSSCGITYEVLPENDSLNKLAKSLRKKIIFDMLKDDRIPASCVVGLLIAMVLSFVKGYRDRGRSYIMQLCNDCCKALFVRATKISMEVRII